MLRAQDEAVDRAEAGPDLGDGGTGGRDAGEVDLDEVAAFGGAQPFGLGQDRRALLGVAAQDDHLVALLQARERHSLADAVRAARDDERLHAGNPPGMIMNVVIKR